jgi:ribose 5-phosphate isomerase B
MIVNIATDHAGFEHKEAVVAWLRKEGMDVVDHGASHYDEGDDFPDFIHRAVEAVRAGHDWDRGIIFGGSGQGEAVLANRYPGIRAAVYYGGNENIPILSRQHNDAKRVIWDWLHTDPLPQEKYRRRNHKIEALTKKVRP